MCLKIPIYGHLMAQCFQDGVFGGNGLSGGRFVESLFLSQPNGDQLYGFCHEDSVIGSLPFCDKWAGSADWLTTSEIRHRQSLARQTIHSLAFELDWRWNFQAGDCTRSEHVHHRKNDSTQKIGFATGSKLLQSVASILAESRFRDRS